MCFGSILLLDELFVHCFNLNSSVLQDIPDHPIFNSLAASAAMLVFLRAIICVYAMQYNVLCSCRLLIISIIPTTLGINTSPSIEVIVHLLVLPHSTYESWFGV